MDAALRELAIRQSDLVAAWQLRAAGWSRKKIEHHTSAHAWHAVHRGVYALTQAQLTRRQQWIAAVLTAPAPSSAMRAPVTATGSARSGAPTRPSRAPGQAVRGG